MGLAVGGAAHGRRLGEQRRDRGGEEGETGRPRPCESTTADTLRKRCTRSVLLGRPSGPGTGTCRDAARRIPEATVARLPLYYRALLETADQDVGTISSERLAELAGVNAAKVRKDLSYLGSYGTRGVGLRRRVPAARDLRASSGSPTTGRSPSSGIGNLGQALANYRGFGARGLPGRRARRRRPGQGRRSRSATSRSSRIDDLDRHRRATARSRSAIIATPGRGGPGGRRPPGRRRASRSILNFAPAVRHGPRGRVAAQGRPRDRAADPLLLPTAPRDSPARRPIA